LVFDNGGLHPRVTSRLTVRGAEPWNRPPPSLFQDLSGREPALDRLDQRHRVTVPRVLDRFSDAYLLWSDCFVLGNLFQNTYYRSRDYHARQFAGLDETALPRRHSGISMVPEGLAIDTERFSAAIEIGDRCLFATPHEPHHWGLWLMSSMVAIERFRRYRSRYGKLFVHVNHPNMLKMLEMMGVTERDVMHHDVSQTYHFGMIDVLRTPGMDFHVYPEEQAMFRGLAKQHGGGGTFRRIFVSRRSRSSDGYRRLLNETELLAAMEALDFAIVEPELLSVAEQMHLFANADVVAGLGGGSMFNTVFCRPGTKVLDIEATSIFLDRHANLFASLGLDYALIVGASMDAGQNWPHGPWSLDVAAALSGIRRFLAM
jgi:hypothetical protein